MHCLDRNGEVRCEYFIYSMINDNDKDEYSNLVYSIFQF